MAFDIGISALFVKPGLVGGAEFMLKNLTEGLNRTRRPSDHLRIFSNVAWPVHGPQDGLFWLGGWRGGNRFVQEWKAARQAGAMVDACLFTNYFTPPTRTARSTRFVTVIHDLQYLHFPQYFTPQKRLWLRAAHELTLRRADRVVVISDFVRDDLLAHYGARWEDKVEVIPNPISFDRFNAPPAPEAGSGIDEAALRRDRYILSVAAHYPHKNLSTLIHAFAQLRQRRGFGDVRLILAGQLGARLVGTVPGRDLELLIQELGLQDAVTVTGHVSDADLGRLYRHAAAFAFPSLFEGFGMPAVEALGFGLPVVTTTRGALPEATCGLARYVEDPLDASAWTSALAEVLEDDAGRPSPPDVNHVRARYSVDRIGKAYYAVLAGEPVAQRPASADVALRNARPPLHAAGRAPVAPSAPQSGDYYGHSAARDDAAP